MSPPFMQLWVGDYLGDTRHLTTEQHGAYLLILMTMWRADGALPADDDKLARIAGLTLARWNKAKGDIMAMLTIENGYVTQKRLRTELEKAKEKSERRADAGRKGGQVKPLNNNKPTEAIASDLLKHSSESEPESESKKQESPSLRSEPKAAPPSKPVRQPEPDGFAEFYTAFPRHTARPAAAKAYAKARARGATVLELLQGALRYRREREHEDPNFTKYPATWLANDCWQDEPAPQPKPGGRNGGHQRNQSFASTIVETVRDDLGEGLFSGRGEAGGGADGPGDQDGTGLEAGPARLPSRAA